MSIRKGLARETLRIIEDRGYTAPSGAWVALGESITRAAGGTRLYEPEQLASLTVPRGSHATRVEVTAETTAQAARRLIETGAPHVGALNYASAKNPGGGFIGGARAQEEDLALCSALYPCLLRQPRYYEANRACGTMLYTHHLIYSPNVPFFRDERLALIESPYEISIITSPAPNAGEALRRDSTCGAAIEQTLRERARHVLLAAADQGVRTLVLGAWGCGVFRNDPDMVSAMFAEWLASTALAGRFEHVTFAIPGRRDDHNLRAFERRFGNARTQG
jgi:uncharacterized protein (TIGR02452 family)